MAGHLEGQLLGTAPQADYVLLRTEDVHSEYPVEEDNWISGAELADSLGCDVLNTSLGYTTFDDSTMDHRYADLDGQTLRMSIAANIASRKGMIPVQSAGNSGASDWYYISAPADAIDILSVGAVGDVENHAWFSSHGPSADGRVKPDVCAMGWGTIVLRADTDSITPANGTSFSSPILAGLVACLWQLHPQRNASEIMAAVRQSASFFNAPNDSLGYGVPDFAAAHAWLVMTTAVAEEVAPAGVVRAYPVPFQHSFSVQLPAEDGVVFLALFDVQGRGVFATRSVVSNGVLQLTDPRLAGLPEGSYFLKVQQGDQLWNLRTAKQP
jgi:subtilisin family serine protease